MHGPGPEMISEMFTDALPTEDPVLYGYADVSPKGSFEARSTQTFTLTYTTGRYGLDDTGSIRIALRFTADGGDLQMEDPTAPNYVTATTSNGVPLRLSFTPNGHVRPWFQALTLHVQKGFLREGDTITIIIGDTSGGSPGYIVQSMCEAAFTWRVLANVCATGHHVPIAESPVICVVPGPPAVWKAVLPTLRRPGEKFRLGIKAEDLYGNPSDQVDCLIKLTSNKPINGLPETINFDPGKRSVILDQLSVDETGPVHIILQGEEGQEIVRTNPLEIQNTDVAAWWGDMHGQSGESVGLNTARQYFEFARDLAFLDAASHQANDFQINGAFWVHINELTAEYHDDGQFLTLPGYEWSGNTSVGGDRNVYFRTEGRTIRRSSHALIKDRSEIINDAPTARALFEDMKDEDCIIYAHIGGRPADVSYAHDIRLETAMEIHSAWGTFEWLMADCFKEGYRVGVVANSDGHKGRPGASYPGTSQFGAYGGLTCFLMDELTRDAWFDCLRQRRHYATTGNRMHIDLEVTSGAEITKYDRDPALGDNSSTRVPSLKMGDIGTVSGSDTAKVKFSVTAGSPIQKIDVMNAMETVSTIRNRASIAASQRLRILWRGAMVKGRGARANWSGRATFEKATIKKTTEINAWNPDRRLDQTSDNSFTWQSVTAGNFGAIDVWLTDVDAEATLNLATNHGSVTLTLADVSEKEAIVECGGLDLELHVARLPQSLNEGPLSGDVDVNLSEEHDNPLWIRVTTEDGFQGWTSPVYLLK